MPLSEAYVILPLEKQCCVSGNFEWAVEEDLPQRLRESDHNHLRKFNGHRLMPIYVLS